MLKQSKHRYEVHTYTLAQGWINCWTVTEPDGSQYPDSFETIELAKAEIDDLLNDIQLEMGETYDRDQFRIYDAVCKVYLA